MELIQMQNSGSSEEDGPTGCVEDSLTPVALLD